MKIKEVNMQEITRQNENYISVREFSEMTGIPIRTIHNSISRIFPEIKVKGKTTYISEYQAGLINKDLKNSHNNSIASTGKVVMTKLEKAETIKKAFQYINEEVEELRKKVEERDNTINLLVHDYTKTYTSTEIAKELNMKSAQELNKTLVEMKIQYKSNNSWVLYSDYSDRNYISLKEQVLDSGKVVYHRLWTGKGRKFLLELLSDKDI